MPLDLARLMNDWFDEHYPNDYIIGPHPNFPARTMLKHTRPCTSTESSCIGEITDIEFEPWVGAGGDAFVYHAADPEFFDKIDRWFRERVLDESWIQKVADFDAIEAV